MKIKRYLVKEMQEAIRLIKQELGPEAVIVSSYKVPAKGLLGLFSPRLLEITAVLDDNPEINYTVGPPAQMAVTDGYHKEITPSMELERGLPGSGFTSPDAKDGLFSDRASNWSIIENMDEQGGYEGRIIDGVTNNRMIAGSNGGPGSRWRKTLLNMDIGEDIVELLLATVGGSKNGSDEQDAYFSLLKQITNLLEPAYSAKSCPRILTFIGPPGCGKTTTLAKLATRFKIFENKNIALVGISNYRIGGFDQLQAYGSFLDVPVEVVMTPEELVKILDDHADKDLILIDTDGRSAWDAGKVLELKGFLNVLEEPHDNFLVLNASIKNRDLIKTANEFQRVGFTKLIFTRVGETETHGSILNLVVKTGVPVAYIANGQKIPDDIGDANPKIIAKLLFRGVDPDEVMAT